MVFWVSHLILSAYLPCVFSINLWPIGIDHIEIVLEKLISTSPTRFEKNGVFSQRQRCSILLDVIVCYIPVLVQVIQV